MVNSPFVSELGLARDRRRWWYLGFTDRLGLFVNDFFFYNWFLIVDRTRKKTGKRFATSDDKNMFTYTSCSMIQLSRLDASCSRRFTASSRRLISLSRSAILSSRSRMSSARMRA